MKRTAKQENRHARSTQAFARAQELMPGGVNSPVRAFKAVGREPLTVRRGSGAYVFDIDGHRYVDYVLSYGPLILGHAPPHVLAAIAKAAAGGTSFGMPTLAEIHLAELVTQAVPSMEQVRFVNSGTEATMSALRLARAATGRTKIVKFKGCYHGHSDALLVQAGSGAATLGVPSSPGVPASVTADTLLAEFNDAPGLERVFAEYGPNIAAVIIEPIVGNMGTIPPQSGYLEKVRQLCDHHGALLIFDEVMTGFRVAYGGAQALYHIKPDLTCLGKVIGGGLPVGAYGGSRALMRQVAPQGPMYQAGTLSGNPLAMAAGIATLKTLRLGGAYKRLELAGATLQAGLEEAARDAGVALRVARVGSMITPFFSNIAIENAVQAQACDTRAFALFFRTMLDRGVMLPPSQFETWFLSTAHDHVALARTLDAAAEALRVVAQSPDKGRHDPG